MSARVRTRAGTARGGNGDGGKKAPSAVDHPSHYNQNPSGVEHLGFNIGNAIKYLWRAGFKSKDPVEDLEKAVWYTQREIERLKRRLQVACPTTASGEKVPR